jgi:hypothetical protein
MTAGFVEFEFDLPDALLQRLIAIFDEMTSAPLKSSNLSDIPDAQGVYQLVNGEDVVYIGKTDGDAGLRQRLTRHASTIRHRTNLDADKISFKAVRVFVFTAMDLETELIRHYTTRGQVAWNKSGFGSNDPGRNRDTTRLRDGHFDLLYPINLDEPIDIHLTPGMSAAAVLTLLRSNLPYYLRFEVGDVGRRPHAELVDATVNTLPQAPVTTRKIIEAVLAALPAGWQATALAGRIILYRENQDYTYGTIIGRSV